MDLSKYPLHELFQFIAAIVPGFAALLIYQAAHPAAFAWFFSLQLVGYKTALTLIVLAAFIVGYTITTFLVSLLGVIAGVIGGVAVVQSRPAHSFKVAPWRDRRWRDAAKKVLGADAPDDTLVIPQESFEFRRKLLESYRDKNKAAEDLVALEQEKLNSEIDDSKWKDVYEHFHEIILSQLPADEFTFHIRTGLNFNLEAAGLYVLVSAMIVPAVRHWWSIVPACVWVLLAIAENYMQIKNYLNKWSTLAAQIRYLSQKQP